MQVKFTSRASSKLVVFMCVNIYKRRGQYCVLLVFGVYNLVRSLQVEAVSHRQTSQQECTAKELLSAFSICLYA